MNDIENQQKTIKINNMKKFKYSKSIKNIKKYFRI